VVMGVKSGLDPAVMVDVINAGSGMNTASRDKFPRSVLPRSFDFGFATGLMVKDVRLAVEEMRSLGLSMEVAEAVGRLWEVIIRDQGADSDFTEAIKPIEKAAGVIRVDVAAGPDDGILVVLDQHFRHQRPRGGGAGLHRAIGACGQDGDEVARFQFRQLAVEREIVAGFAGRADDVGGNGGRTRGGLAHRQDVVMRLVQRRADQIVHRGVDDARPEQHGQAVGIPLRGAAARHQ
ncbi:hypothetical protein KXV85_000930, partial [Aspergillus fumigatus]